MSYLARLKDEISEKPSVESKGEISEKSPPNALTKPTEGLLSALSVPEVGTFEGKGCDLGATIQAACQGIDGITPDQFMVLLNDQDKAAIAADDISEKCLRGYAKSFAEGIQSGRILFHPRSGALVRHGLA